NRAVFKFNDTLDGYILKPAAKGYDAVTPAFARTGVRNFFSNLNYPLVFTNQFLQGKFKLAVQDTGRFLINSTFGLAGLIDVAEEFGLEEHNEDFGQTFGTWGMASGPYIVLPIFGPSNVRDGLGFVAHSYADPFETRYINERRATKNRLKGLSLLETRAGLLQTEKLLSGDKYSFMRDTYLQRRADLIADGVANETDPFLDD
ncbi:MAG: phospholipid-binding lipoprotein MlaA, partial [bacterium]